MPFLSNLLLFPTNSHLVMADKYVRRKEVDPGIELSSPVRSGRDSGNESEVGVDGVGLGFPRSLRGSYTKKTIFFAKQLCRTVLTLR